MPITITDVNGETAHLPEESSGVVIISFTDQEGDPVTPNEVKWSLTDDAGNVINNRDQISETPAQTLEILLSGDDLVIQQTETGNTVKRHIVIEATYNSATYGNNIPLKEDGIFYVDNLRKIA